MEREAGRLMGGAAASLPFVAEHLAPCCPANSSSATSSRAKCRAHRHRTHGGCTATVTAEDLLETQQMCGQTCL